MGDTGWTEEQKVALNFAAKYYDAYCSKVIQERKTPHAVMARVYHNVAETLRAMAERSPEEVEALIHDICP